MNLGNVAFCAGDDGDLEVGRVAIEGGNRFLVPAQPVQALGYNDIELVLIGVRQKLLIAMPQGR